MSELLVAPPTASRVRQQTARTSAGTESVALVTRALRLSSRNVEALITAFALPVILMLMFVYIFGGAINTGTSYVNYVVPGVVLICVGFGAGTTAVSVAHDLSGAIIDRFRSMDVRGEALILGQVVASVVRNLFSTALVFAVAVAIGFRSDAGPLQWLEAMGLLALFILALSWLAAAIGMFASDPEAANGLAFAVSFLPYISSAIVPVATMPSWLQPVAAHQPVTLTIDAMRELLVGGSAGNSAWLSVLWSVGITVVSVVFAGLQFRRRTT